jgi:hypothetical protein
MNQNNWLEFNEKYIRKSSITAYFNVGKVVEIHTHHYAYNKLFETYDDSYKYMEYLHDLLMDSL